MVKELNIQQMLCDCGSGKEAKTCCAYENSLNNIKSLLQSAIASSNKEQFTAVERLCLELLQVNSQDVRLLQMLYFSYLNTNRIVEAINILKRISIFIQDPIKLSRCYSDLGNMLNNSGQKEEAEDYLKKSITINPNYAPAYYNLGVLYLANKNNSLAIANFKEAIKHDPNFTAAYNNLARALAENPAHLDEAINYQKKAVALEPNSESLLDNLSISLYLNGNFNEAVETCQKVLAINPIKWDSFERLLDNLLDLGEFDSLITIINTTLASTNKPSLQCLKKMYFLLELIHFGKKDYDLCKQYLSKGNELYNLPLDEEPEKSLPLRVYHNYFSFLVKYYYEHLALYDKSYSEVIYAIGESHCLAPTHVIVNLNNKNYQIQSNIISGCKIWHLITTYSNSYKTAFKITLAKIPVGATILFCLGEIDCRINKGIMEFYQKNPTINLDDHIAYMVRDYVSLLIKAASEFKVIIQGVPAPRIDLSNHPLEQQKTFLYIIKTFNQLLKAECASNNIKFLDVYSLTANDQGTSNELFHLDMYHLKPEYIHKVLT